MNMLYDTCEDIVMSTKGVGNYESYKLTVLGTLGVDHPIDHDHFVSVSEANLTEDSSTRGCDLDGSIGRGRNDAGVLSSTLPVNNAQHGRHQVDGEYIVGISEEADTGDDNGTNMVPLVICQRHVTGAC